MRRIDRTPPTPAREFAFLLVEGGDERRLCAAILDEVTWSGLICWSGDGQSDLSMLAGLAAHDANIEYARSIGVILDAEESINDARTILASIHSSLGIHAPRLRSFISPDNLNVGAIEALSRRAVRDPRRASCVDALFTCAGANYSTTARRDKAWINAYAATLPDPTLRGDQLFAHTDGIDPAHEAFSALRAFLNSL